MKGTFFKIEGDTQKEIFTITYNDEKDFPFDVDILIQDNTNFNSDEHVIEFLKQFDGMYNPAENKRVSISKKDNLDLLIDTLSTFYSSAHIGMLIDKGQEDESKEN